MKYRNSNLKLLRRFIGVTISALCFSIAPAITAQQADQHYHKQENPLLQKTEQTEPTPIAGSFSELASDHVIGDSKAPIRMIIYASVTCPHCAHWFNEIWPDFKTNYVDTGKVRVVFREFITAPANISAIGFQIANCAPQDKYFDAIALQMKEQKSIFKALEAGSGKEKYLEIAKQAGLEDEAAMEKCITNEAGIERINKSMQLAKSAKIKGVPNFIINGKIYEGDSELKPLSQYIDKSIKKGATQLLKR